MTGVLVELGLVAFLLCLNGLFSASEMAIVSSKKTRLQQWADEGSSGAARALRLANEPGRFLSTVQIGITLVGILSGVFSGAKAAGAIEAFVVENLPALAKYARIIGVGVMVSIVTYLAIVVGELVPKRIALHSPEKFAAFIAPPMEALSRLASPFVAMLDVSTDLLLKLAGRHTPAEEPPVTGEEIKSLVEQGAQAGVFEAAEKDIMHRVLAFGDNTIHAMMTPRPQIISLDVEDDMEVNRFKITAAPHSHFPLVKGTLDNVMGTVHVKDILSYDAQTSDDLVSILTQPLFLPESSSPIHVIETFRRTGVHVAFVIDEYGGIQGMVTLTDLLEAIVGELPSGKPDEKQIVERDDGSCLVEGTIPIGEFKTHFKIASLPGEEKAGFQTLAGFLLTLCGRVPRTGEILRWQDYAFEVVDMDGQRIDKVLVGKSPTAAAR